jgi:serine/threonine protein kinase
MQTVSNTVTRFSFAGSDTVDTFSRIQSIYLVQYFTTFTYINSVGKDAYRAPEVKQGCYGVRADIWSVGVLLSELMTLGKSLPILSDQITSKTQPQVHQQLKKRMKVRATYYIFYT